MKPLLTLLLLTSLSGCATVDHTAQRAELARTAPTCLTDRECELKWSAARSWVLANSGWKIQHLTNDFIETYNPVGSSTNIAVRVVKEPIAKGGY
jgi:hypothetical protein